MRERRTEKGEETLDAPVTNFTEGLAMADNTTIPAPDYHQHHQHHHHQRHQPFFLPTGVIVVFVLASLCAILGVIYAYVYYTKISKSGPSSKKKKRALKMPKGGSEMLRVAHVYDDEKNLKDSSSIPPSTHVFLFKWRR